MTKESALLASVIEIGTKASPPVPLLLSPPQESGVRLYLVSTSSPDKENRPSLSLCESRRLKLNSGITRPFDARALLSIGNENVKCTRPIGAAV